MQPIPVKYYLEIDFLIAIEFVRERNGFNTNEYLWYIEDYYDPGSVFNKITRRFVDNIYPADMTIEFQNSTRFSSYEEALECWTNKPVN